MICIFIFIVGIFVFAVFRQNICLSNSLSIMIKIRSSIKVFMDITRIDPSKWFYDIFFFCLKSGVSTVKKALLAASLESCWSGGGEYLSGFLRKALVLLINGMKGFTVPLRCLRWLESNVPYTGKAAEPSGILFLISTLSVPHT